MVSCEYEVYCKLIWLANVKLMLCLNLYEIMTAKLLEEILHVQVVDNKWTTLLLPSNKHHNSHARTTDSKSPMLEQQSCSHSSHDVFRYKGGKRTLEQLTVNVLC